MRKYLSHGMGVNSTALMLLLIDDGIEFESVFSDTGCEKPETYEYLDFLDKEGYEITRITPQVKGQGEEKGLIYNNLYDYFWSWQGIPIIHRRECTYKFKKKPVDRYVKQPCEVMIGYDFNERKSRHTKKRKQIIFTFPLIERQITREHCIKIIRDHGLPVPVKSSCYLCPFQSKTQWKHLRDKHPELFKKALKLEQNARIRNPKKSLYHKYTHLSSIWQENKLTRYLEDEK